MIVISRAGTAAATRRDQEETANDVRERAIRKRPPALPLRTRGHGDAGVPDTFSQVRCSRKYPANCPVSRRDGCLMHSRGATPKLVTERPQRGRTKGVHQSPMPPCRPCAE